MRLLEINDAREQLLGGAVDKEDRFVKLGENQQALVHTVEQFGVLDNGSSRLFLQRWYVGEEDGDGQVENEYAKDIDALVESALELQELIVNFPANHESDKEMHHCNVNHLADVFSIVAYH